MTSSNSLEELKPYLKPRSFNVYKRANDNCNKLITEAKDLIENYLLKNDFNTEQVSIVAVGSVGRSEALESSDLDLIPILNNDQIYNLFKIHDQKLRELIKDKLKIKVSRGEDLTKCISINDLTNAESIGGSKDDSGALTKRVLILTESMQVGGGYSLKLIRQKILEAYAKEERTSGRHVLSLCNDLARYYRTLCIEYKAKIDIDDKDWSTRNLKLRHSRKLWYFSNLISIVKLSEVHPRGENDFIQALLKIFDSPPFTRLIDALVETQPIEVGRLLESYSIFLEFMASSNNREKISKISHNNRFKVDSSNPFLAMKFNSDIMHKHLITIIEGLSPTIRRRVIDWFLL